MKFEALTKDEITSVIEGTGRASRVPTYIHFWVHPGAFEDREQAVLDLMAEYPCDIQLVPFCMPTQYKGDNPDHPDYTWLPYPNPYVGRTVPIDEAIAMDDWSQLDAILETFPSPEFEQLFAAAPDPDGRYRLANWFFCLFERHWSLRGMTNALMDYYEYPEETHRLFDALTTFYCRIIERAGREQACNGLWTSDDLGTQNGGFFSVDIFREFYKPYYKRIFDACHANGMHAWMHACGCVTEYIPDWLEIGLDVLHPIQKHTMVEADVAAEYGADLTIFAGIDVQQVIPWGTPDEVREEVRFLIDTYWRPGEGRCMITAGNGINGDCTLPSLEAFFDEAFTYGQAKVQGG